MAYSLEWLNGYEAGLNNEGTQGDETDEWLAGFVEGTEIRIELEIESIELEIESIGG